MQNKYEKDENKILIAKICDKKKFCEMRNKITVSDFLNQSEKRIVLKDVNMNNAFFFGGNENSDREIVCFYPEKINRELAIKSLGDILSVVRIILPNELKGQYMHRNYLSALMKIGMTREKIGDILAYGDGADIIVFNVNAEFVCLSLSQLTRFKKAEIKIVSIFEVREKKDKFEEFSIIVSSLRVDAIVAELAHCSRNMANEYINEEKVMINYEVVYKGSKMVQEKDIITIRGKGKFVIDGLVRNTKKGNLVIKLKKFI